MLALLLALQAPVLEAQASGTKQRLQAVSPVSASVVWVSGTGGTWGLTVDGGKTWRTAMVPGADSLEFRDVQGFDARRALLLAAGPGDKSRIYQTSDGGATWAQRFVNTEPTAFYDCFAFWDATSGFVISDAVNGVLPILRTADGGRQWTVTPSSPAALNGEGAFAASGTCVATWGDSLAWIATGAGAQARVLRSSDRGATWTAVVTPIVQGKPSSGHASIAFRSAGVGLAAGGDLADTTATANRVVLTADGGATWTPGGAPSFRGAVFGAAFAPGGTAAVAVGPLGASWSRDGGRTWLPLDTLSHWSVAFVPPLRMAERGTGGEDASASVGWMVGPAGRITKIQLP